MMLMTVSAWSLHLLLHPHLHRLLWIRHYRGPCYEDSLFVRYFLLLYKCATKPLHLDAGGEGGLKYDRQTMAPGIRHRGGSMARWMTWRVLWFVACINDTPPLYTTSRYTRQSSFTEHARHASTTSRQLQQQRLCDVMVDSFVPWRCTLMFHARCISTIQYL